MAYKNILIESGQGKSARERADGISTELYNIKSPEDVKHAKDATKFLFRRLSHPTTGEACLFNCDEDYEINVHNKVNLNKLLAYFEKIPNSEKKALQDYITANKGKTITFKNIIPSTAINITHEEMINKNWFTI